jgi:hypothetical protein
VCLQCRRLGCGREFRLRLQQWRPDSKTGKKSIILNAPAIAVLAGLERAGGYVIAGQSARTENEKPRADLNRPWR